MKINENNILEDVHYIKYTVLGENGVSEDEMSSSDVNDFIELINDLNLKQVKESQSIKGWFIAFDCFNDKREQIYDISLIRNLLHIDETVYCVDENDLDKLLQFISNKLTKD